MKLIFKKKDGNVHLPRKAKDEAKKNIKQVLSGGVLKNLQKTIIGNHSAYDRDYAIYSEENVDYQKIFSIENHQTNYLAGQITSDIFFLVDIGELVWVVDHFEMMDFEENKRIITHLKSILGNTMYYKPPYLSDDIGISQGAVFSNKKKSTGCGLFFLLTTLY